MVKGKPTPERDTLRAAMLNAPSLARLSGVPVDTVRGVLNGKHRPRATTRRKLAEAIRAHSGRLAFLADQLDPPDQP